MKGINAVTQGRLQWFMRRRDLFSVVPQSGTKEDASFCFYETGVTGVCLLVASCFRTYVPSALALLLHGEPISLGPDKPKKPNRLNRLKKP
jgi:hypothetical protein